MGDDGVGEVDGDSRLCGGGRGRVVGVSELGLRVGEREGEGAALHVVGGMRTSAYVRGGCYYGWAREGGKQDGEPVLLFARIGLHSVDQPDKPAYTSFVFSTKPFLKPRAAECPWRAVIVGGGRVRSGGATSRLAWGVYWVISHKILNNRSVLESTPVDNTTI